MSYTASAWFSERNNKTSPLIKRSTWDVFAMEKVDHQLVIVCVKKGYKDCVDLPKSIICSYEI
jgi:hypothetical protein